MEHAVSESKETWRDLDALVGYGDKLIASTSHHLAHAFGKLPEGTITRLDKLIDFLESRVRLTSRIERIFRQHRAHVFAHSPSFCIDWCGLGGAGDTLQHWRKR